ncbi:MAG: DNA repair protein RecN, partial [Candidatus Poribacteria bacterium]|nr:DNA repair protein RecN [Candidatus Poribacteria bacterium]
MLCELRIEHLAVIDALRLEFRPGLNVLTGETGAGKSIILGALGLVLGDKADSNLVRTGEDAAFVEAAIEVDLPDTVAAMLHEAGIVVSRDEPIIVARQVNANGRGRSYVSGRMATNQLLQTLGEAWIDIHGQHEHQSLFRIETHLALLDAFAKTSPLRELVSDSYDRILTLRRRLRDLQQEQRQTLLEREHLEHERDEIEAAALEVGEDERLEQERNRLANAERLFETANDLYERLYNATRVAVVEQLRRASGELAELRRLDESLKELEKRLESVFYETEDIAFRIRDYRSTLEFNPQRLGELEERLQRIFQLKRKYGESIEDILARCDAVRAKLRVIETGADEIDKIKEELRVELREAGRLAFELSERRQEAALRLQSEVETELAQLAMDKSRFFVSVTPMESDQGLIRRRETGYNLTASGIDRVEFLIAPNVGEEARPLNRIASGGELSRVMLAMKTVLSAMDPISTLVFDEVDSGVGGETGTVVGRKLCQLASTAQVICITHLPQIAAMADHHI